MASREAPHRSGASRAGQRCVEIQSEAIDLGDLLKLARVVASGGEAKRCIQGGQVRVNGGTERRRGRQIVPGDRVAINGTVVIVTARRAGRAPTK